MKKSNLELFKQALNEGLSNRIDRTVNECTVKIKPSKQHTLAMRTILYGKGYHSKPLSPKMRQVIAILVAAAMLLTSCAIIYRDEIHGFIEEITEHFTRIKHSDETKSDNTINEIYEFTYIPEGYTLEKSYDNPLLSKNIFCNSEGDVISLSQFVSDNTIFFIDDENYITILELDMCDVYYKTTNGKHYYLWIFDKYTFELEATKELSNDDLSSVIISAKSK